MPQLAGHQTLLSPSPREINTEAVRTAEALGQGTYDAYPMRVTLEVTADCNLRCPHCEFTPPRAWKDKHDPGRILHVSLDDVKRFAATVFPHVRELVPSVVGEPMMYPHWDGLLDLCAEYGVFLEIYTNGSYLTEESLARLGPVTSKLIVSMDGASPATFNNLRRPSDFDDIVSRLGLVKVWRAALPLEQRPRVHIHSVLTLHWVDELVDMVRLVKEQGVDELSVGHLIAYNEHWQQFQPGRDPERTDRALRAASEEAARLGVSATLPRLFGTGEDVSHRAPPAFPLRDKVEPVPPPKDRKYWCKYLWREVFIAIGGEVAPCCGIGRPTVDNVRTNFELKQIFAHPELARMREGMVKGDLHPACATCPQLSMYGGLDYKDADFTSTYATLDAVVAQQKAGRGCPSGDPGVSS